jgi:hypothetical protein
MVRSFLDLDFFRGIINPPAHKADRVQRDLDRYRDEMADDAPGSGTPEDNP